MICFSTVQYMRGGFLMAEDINKGMQKIGDDDLFSVSGGMSGEGLHTDAESFYRGLGNAFFSGIEGKKGTGGMPGFAGDETGDAGGAGLGIAMSECPVCGEMTEHIVFTGGRGKCKTCGNIKEKL